MPSSAHAVTLYEERIRLTLQELGIPPAWATTRRPSLHLECSDLVSIGLDATGREHWLARMAAAPWQTMRDLAAREGVSVEAVSAFRSFERQKQIIARKLAAGQTIAQILSVNALPGFSEHHSGRAIDIGTSGCPVLTAAFEQTAAYAWLCRHAPSFGFQLSYPRNNPHGVIFEPWHWYYSGNLGPG